MLKSNKNIKVIDLFSGIGGLTYGFKSAGLNVVAGIDNDSTCKYGYETSNKTRFILKDINDVSSEELEELYKDSDIKVLAGCAPCQPYSKLNQKGATDQKMMPLKKFALLIREIKPDIVSMENVGGLVNKDKYPVFADFLAVLDELGYYYDYKVINTADYGVPQSRKRLVLLASRLGPISVPKPTHDKLILDCHKKESGKSFGSVYGRMWWDKPASTMTTQCIGIGNGRFGHPEQDRAISLREAARIQTFPDDYVFFDDNEEMTIGAIAKFIGNAVPVRLGEVLGTTIQEHVNCRL